MLKLYRRHRVSCSHRALAYRRCQCPIYVKGSLGGTSIRMSLDQTAWDAATKIIGRWIDAGVIGQIEDTSQTIAAAVAAFEADAADRSLASETRAKYKLSLGRLEAWSTDEGIALLRDLDVDRLTRFRAKWPGGAISKSKHQERLRSFFKWCLARKWIAENPAKDLSKIQVRDAPTLPFDVDEWARIITALDKYPARHRDRTKAFVLMLRWSGLRIRDVATLEWSRLTNGNKLFLRTQKTGVPVYVPLPPEVIAAWQALPKVGRYPFWSGRGKPKSAVGDWQRTLGKVFKLADPPVEDGHAHRFRDTFAVELLLAGVDIQDVSILLGHSSVKITEKHYAPWVQARQSRLEAAVQKAWAS